MLTREDIDCVIERIGLDIGLSYPTDPLMEVCKGLGIELLCAVLPDLNGKPVRAVIKKIKDRENNNSPRVRILIRSFLSRRIVSFEIAHQIGHAVLHLKEDEPMVDLVNYSLESSPSDKEMEIEADMFALSLLMPEQKFLPAAMYGEMSVADLARCFAVSEPAVSSRLNSLRVIGVRGAR